MSTQRSYFYGIAVLLAGLGMMGCEPMTGMPAVPTAPADVLSDAVATFSETRAQTARGDCDWDGVSAGLTSCGLVTGTSTAYAACTVVVWQSYCEDMSYADFVDEVSQPQGPFGGGGGGAW